METNKSAFEIKDICYIALFTALICILAQVAIPLPMGVPMTLQTLIIPFAGLILGSKKGFISTLLYLLLGAVGLPVFANFAGGIGIILSLTGGFIISFPLMPLLAGYFENKGFKLSGNKRSGIKYIAYLLLGLILGAILNYAIGTVWFVVVSGNSFAVALMACVVPFIPTAILKIIIAAVAAPIVKTALIKAGVLAVEV